MRNCYIIGLLLLTVSSSVVGQGWVAVDFPLEENITGICFVHPDTGFAVTDKGYCARTYDAGKTWKVLSVASDTHLEDVSFVNGSLGVVCGRRGGLYRTLDGGATWENKSLKDTLPWFGDVEMFNAKTGLVIGMTRDSLSPFGSLIYRTVDGGATWKKQQPLGSGNSEILYRSGGPVYLLSFGQLHISHDLGRSWQSIRTVNGALARTLSILGKTGILAGPNGMYAYSSDTGQTWTASDRPANKVYIAAELVDEQVGYIGGAPATVMRTADGGQTWDQEVMARSFDVLDMCLIGDRLYAVGSNGGMIYKKVR
jgi:photosystem II stability/assembly factor-like uncharacterized protein